MPHATSLCEQMQDFIALHKAQLVNSCIPERFWESLFMKMKQEILDAGDSFAILKVEEVWSDIEDEDGGGGGGGGTAPGNDDEKEFYWKVVAKHSLLTEDPDNIFLVDHTWSYQLENARTHLETNPSLLQRMAALMEVNMTDKDKDDIVDEVLEEMWRFNQTYSIDAAGSGGELKRPIWYIQDEFGSRIQHSDVPTVRTVPFFYVPNQATYTVMWPVKDLSSGDEVTRNYVEKTYANGLLRKIMLLPWQPDDMTHLSAEQGNKDDSFFMKYNVLDSLPLMEQTSPELARDRCVRVYTDVPYVSQYLRDPRFELVNNFDEADIIWTSTALTDFESFSEESPNKLINQFPCEMVLTVKDLFSVIARRAGSRLDPITLEAPPAWFQATYNLQEELPQFVSYFQQRENKEMPNYWLCQPHNPEGGFDLHITNNLNHILRLCDTGPMVASRYIEDPVLFDYADEGMMKFDMRYAVLLHATAPLKLSVYRRFIVRFANEPFEMDHLDDLKKHLTLDQDEKESKIKDMDCEDFVEQFQEQYTDDTWNTVEEFIFGAIQELFESATSRAAPAGIGHSPQSRAMYGVDVMLKWITNNKGEKQMQPVLSGVTFNPDGKHFCRCRSDFVDDVFGALLLDDYVSGNIALL